MNFIRKYVLVFILDFWYKNFKSLFAVNKFTAKRVTEVSFFEVTKNFVCSSFIPKDNKDFLNILPVLSRPLYTQ